MTQHHLDKTLCITTTNSSRWLWHIAKPVSHLLLQLHSCLLGFLSCCSTCRQLQLQGLSMQHCFSCLVVLQFSQLLEALRLLQLYLYGRTQQRKVP